MRKDNEYFLSLYQLNTKYLIFSDYEEDDYYSNRIGTVSINRFFDLCSRRHLLQQIIKESLYKGYLC